MRIHGMHHTPEYTAWKHMRARCLGKVPDLRASYFYRGIRVCEEWMGSFQKFFDHVGPRPSDKHSIDRINNDGNYEPGNVRWATASQQAFNKRKKTHCCRGHEFNVENTGVRPDRRRWCRVCHRNRNRLLWNIKKLAVEKESA